MEEYKPPFTITNKMLSYVSTISEKIGGIHTLKPLEEQSAASHHGLLIQHRIRKRKSCVPHLQK